MKIQHFYDQETFTLTYIVFDEDKKDAIIIDPVLNYDPASSTISTKSVNKLISYIKENKLNIHYILETHAHADHLSGAIELKKVFPNAKIAIGENIKRVQKEFTKIYNFRDFKSDGHQFDHLLKDNEVVSFGSLEFKVINTPGHTPACVSYLIEDAVFTGDALFMPDYGTGRCDFPMGSAKELYHSIHDKLYSLPSKTKVYTGHDYQPNGRELKYETSIEESLNHNIQLNKDTSEQEFVSFRESRDKTLNAPRLLLPSIQVNIDAGRLPEKENNGQRYLKIPVKGE